MNTTAPTPYPGLTSLSGEQWPDAVGALWEAERSRFATGWDDLPHHNRVSVYRLLVAQEKALRKEAAANHAAYVESCKPKPEPEPNNTLVFLKFTTNGQKEGVHAKGDNGVEDPESAQYLTMPHDEAVKFVDWYHDFDDWCGLGVHAYVRLVELDTIPAQELEENGQPPYFYSARETAIDFYFIEG